MTPSTREPFAQTRASPQQKLSGASPSPPSPLALYHPTWVHTAFDSPLELPATGHRALRPLAGASTKDSMTCPAWPVVAPFRFRTSCLPFESSPGATNAGSKWRLRVSELGPPLARLASHATSSARTSGQERRRFLMASEVASAASFITRNGS